MKDTGKSKRKSVIVFCVVMCFAVVGSLGVYYKYMKKQQQRQQTVKKPATEVEKLIAKDLEAGYPETPKELTNLFCRYTQCIYNKSLSEEQISSLVSQLRILYCDELKERNEQGKMEQKIAADIRKYKKDEKRIISYTVDGEKNYQYQKLDGKDTVYVNYSFFMREKDKYSTWNQRVILLKENDKWKILGFGPAPSSGAAIKE